VILDLDGCVWVGDAPTPGAAEAVAALRAAGMRVAFVTNDPRRPEEGYVQKLWGMGIQASLDDVVTVGAAVEEVLAQTYGSGHTAFVIGTPALRDHVGRSGVRVVNGTEWAGRADLVVVGGTEDLVYDDLREATLSVRAGADLIGTSRDPTYPTEEGHWPGTGAILAAVEYASGREAQIVGKPEAALFRTALGRLGDGPTLVVGDRLDADVAAATRAGLDAALVLTGGTSRDEAAAAKEPVAVADTLAELVLGS
jgi:HAD superfamily hydrolase (TIGR01450 family)